MNDPFMLLLEEDSSLHIEAHYADGDVIEGIMLRAFDGGEAKSVKIFITPENMLSLANYLIERLK